MCYTKRSCVTIITLRYLSTFMNIIYMSFQSIKCAENYSTSIALIILLPAVKKPIFDFQSFKSFSLAEHDV